MVKAYFAIGAVSLVVLAALQYLYYSAEVRSLQSNHGQKHEKCSLNNGQRESLEIAMKKRNEMSHLLNQLKQDYGKLSCEMLELKSKHGEKVDTSVSQFGGWCKEVSKSNKGQHVFDDALAEGLSHFFSSQRVASFGDGPGDYKAYIDKTGRVQVYDSYDGAPYSEENSYGAVKFLDLTAPQYGLPAYDWIMSLEVAEHIPSKFESVYVDNIVRHAKEGIVLSWAVPGQGGLSHVNNRPLEYVIKMLREKGFDHDNATSVSLQMKAKLGWLKKNINVFLRNSDSPLKQDDL